MFDFITRAVARVVNEPAAVVAGAIAALNATTNQTWEGYAAAVAVFLVRFVVTGPLSEVSE